MTDQPHVLYRAFNDAGDLLYVGITNNPKNRFREHGKSKTWWAEVANIKVETFKTRKELAWAEYRAIKGEGPRYNIACNPVLEVTPPKCGSCGSPSPELMPDDEFLLNEDGQLIPFCTDPYHFPDLLGAERVHANRDLLRQARLLRFSEEAERRMEIRRAAMEKALAPSGEIPEADSIAALFFETRSA